MPQLSVVVITLNEEKNIGRCLAAARQVADDIVVVDSFSTDQTEAICRTYGVQFHQRTWQGYAATKNEAHTLARFDWILSLDADEELSPELIASILDWKARPLPADREAALAPAWAFQRLASYCGKWMYHSGWYPDRKTRLFHRQNAYWSGAYVHETLAFRTPVPVHLLKGHCYHYTVTTLSEQVAVFDRYAQLQAQQMLDEGRRVTMFHLLFKPLAHFWITLLARRGILDGLEGWILAGMGAWAQFLKYAKVLMARRQARRNADEMSTSRPEATPPKSPGN